VWDYVFLKGKYPAKCAIPQKTLDKLKAEFEYW
jgi:leucyl-tRNA synthetase